MARISRSQFRRQQRALEWGVTENFTPYQRGRVKKQFNRKCFNCHSTRKLCIDHHLPLSKGHPLEYGNGVVLCRACNSAKGTKSPEMFYSPKQLAILSKLLSLQRGWRNKSKPKGQYSTKV